MELGQYERGLTDCRVASRLLKQEERLLGEREVEQVVTVGASAVLSSVNRRVCDSFLYMLPFQESSPQRFWRERVGKVFPYVFGRRKEGGNEPLRDSDCVLITA